jgi:hypothetical protein
MIDHRLLATDYLHMPTAETDIETFANQEYKWGFVTDIESDTLPPGLSEETVRFISVVDAGMAFEGVSSLVDDDRAASLG